MQIEKLRDRRSSLEDLRTKETKETERWRGRNEETKKRRNDRAKPWELYVVILNEVKNLLVGNTLCALSLVGCEEMLRQAQHDIALM